MRRSSFNLTGDWSGHYSYPRGFGPTTPFLARIEDDGGRFTGTIVEPDTLTGRALTASITGLRHGTSVDFTKTYGPGARFGYENPVDYVGSLSEDGNVLKGVWSLLELDGTFEMHREAAAEEEDACEAEVALPEPVSVP